MEIREKALMQKWRLSCTRQLIEWLMAPHSKCASLHPIAYSEMPFRADFQAILSSDAGCNPAEFRPVPSGPVTIPVPILERHAQRHTLLLHSLVLTLMLSCCKTSNRTKLGARAMRAITTGHSDFFNSDCESNFPFRCVYGC